MTASTSSPAPRRYRFAPLVRTGLFGGMPTAQAVVLSIGVGLSFGGILLRLFPWALTPALAAAVVAFKRVGTWPLYELIVRRCVWWRGGRSGRHEWFRPVPLLGGSGRTGNDLPAPLAGLRMLDVEASWALTGGRVAGVAVIHDTRTETLTAALRVTGDGQFSLCSAAEQDGRIAGWGDALAAFCKERRTISRVTWQEWSNASPLAPATAPPGCDTTPATDYAALVGRAAPRVTVHEVIASISVDIRTVGSQRRSTSTSTLDAGTRLLVDELRLFSQRLEAAGLAVEPPFSPAEMTALVRRRSDPFASPTTAGVSLAAGLGMSMTSLAPMGFRDGWDHARIDGAVHRSWWIEGWPRLEVPAAWLDLVLLGNAGTRTVTLVFCPIAPSQAARAIDEAAVAIEAAESAKTKHGFRVRAKDRRARDEIEQREQELVAGHSDLEFVGFIDLAVRSTDELDDATNELEQVTGRAGLQLRALDGRHGAGWVAGLPLGR